MDTTKIEELREKLRGYVTYESGQEIRDQIREFYIKNYNRKYNDTECFGFVKRHTPSIHENHPQGTNHIYYYTLFSCLTQHIEADTIEELFDKAIDIEKNKI